MIVTIARCKSCKAIINPRWKSCLVCDSPVGAITGDTKQEQKAEGLEREPGTDKGCKINELTNLLGDTREGHISTALEAFDPDGALASLLECAGRKGISDAQVASIVDDLIKTKSLKAPWGIKIKNSPILGDYWVVSDDQAKKHIPSHEVVFTAEDIGLLTEVREIFGPVKTIGVKREIGETND